MTMLPVPTVWLVWSAGESAVQLKTDLEYTQMYINTFPGLTPTWLPEKDLFCFFIVKPKNNDVYKYFKLSFTFYLFVIFVILDLIYT